MRPNAFPAGMNEVLCYAMLRYVLGTGSRENKELFDYSVVEQRIGGTFRAVEQRVG